MTLIDKVKSILFFLFGILLAFFSTLNAQSSSDAYRTETFSVDENPSVSIRTSGGFIEAVGHLDDEVRVEMYVKKRSRYFSPSDTDLDDYEIEIYKEGNTITASAEKESSGAFGWFGSGDNFSVSFIVYAPESAFIDGRTSGGQVSAENFNNEITLRTSGGSVTAMNIQGTADFRTSGGSMKFEDLNGTISARTSGGTIRADEVSGVSDFRTSGGSIRIENAAGALSARTSGGSIRAHFVEFSDDADLRTSGGSIRIDLPPVEHFSLDLNGGRVKTNLRNFTGNSERNRINGQIGDGGPKISARTSGGTVELVYE